MGILEYGFMQRAFAAGIIIALIAPLIGIFLVVKRLSLIADTLAHVSLFGVALGVATGFDPVYCGLGGSIAASLIMERVRASKKIFSDSMLAIFLWGGLASAVIIVGRARGVNVDLMSYLFGSIATVSTHDLYASSILGLCVLLTVVIFYKQFFLVSFNEELATVRGINTRLLNTVILIAAAITIGVSMRIVGILLVGALMVIPVIASMQLQRSFRETLIISVIISIFSVISGLVFSYYLEIASGGTIILVTISIFIIIYIFKR